MKSVYAIPYIKNILLALKYTGPLDPTDRYCVVGFWLHYHLCAGYLSNKKLRFYFGSFNINVAIVGGPLSAFVDSLSANFFVTLTFLQLVTAISSQPLWRISVPHSWIHFVACWIVLQSNYERLQLEKRDPLISSAAINVVNESLKQNITVNLTRSVGFIVQKAMLLTILHQSCANFTWSNM